MKIADAGGNRPIARAKTTTSGTNAQSEIVYLLSMAWRIRDELKSPG